MIFSKIHITNRIHLRDIPMTDLTFCPATQDDIEQIVDIIIGDPNQLSTQVGMKLFGITRLSQAKRLFTAMAQIV